MSPKAYAVERFKNAINAGDGEKVGGGEKREVGGGLGKIWKCCFSLWNSPWPLHQQVGRKQIRPLAKLMVLICPSNTKPPTNALYYNRDSLQRRESPFLFQLLWRLQLSSGGTGKSEAGAIIPIAQKVQNVVPTSSVSATTLHITPIFKRALHSLVQ